MVTNNVHRGDNDDPVFGTQSSSAVIKMHSNALGTQVAIAVDYHWEYIARSWCTLSHCPEWIPSVGRRMKRQWKVALCNNNNNNNDKSKTDTWLQWVHVRANTKTTNQRTDWNVCSGVIFCCFRFRRLHPVTVLDCIHARQKGKFAFIWHLWR